MNIIFGMWRPHGPSVIRQELESIAVHTRVFAPDGEWFRVSDDIGFGIQAQYTHVRSRLEIQPASDVASNIVVYDGRLDNYQELAEQLGLEGEEASDSEIVLSSYRQWGEDCFRRFIGDWALALWDARSRELYLARDHAGTRLLHYSSSFGTIVWATYLDSYVSTSRLDLLDPVYLASYLAMVPCYGRSPYQEVSSVLPGHFLKATLRGTTISRFWTPALDEASSDRSTDDYKTEFLYLFKQAVARRTGPGAPILAHLSGGMDSTSIVCVADRLRQISGSKTQTLDSLSYFDDSEPNWNERPYFKLIEEKRDGRAYHVDSSLYRPTFERPSGYGARYLYPGIDGSSIRHDLDLNTIVRPGGYRSILSGIGGDEFTGGNPTPATELVDAFARGRVIAGTHCAIDWCIAQHLSLVELLGRGFSFLRTHLPSASRDLATNAIPWLSGTAREQCGIALGELPVAHFIPLAVRPKMVELSETWWYTLRTQAHLKPSEVFRYEYRYPYLDRNLVEFLLRLPAEELARPGRRRFLMREALKDIVPSEILERRRKAFLLASPLVQLRKVTPRIEQAIRQSVLADAGLIDRALIQKALSDTLSGNTTRLWSYIVRFATLETWLQHHNRGTSLLKTTTDPVSADALTETAPVTQVHR